MSILTALVLTTPPNVDDGSVVRVDPAGEL
jgi:hypothetical protein